MSQIKRLKKERKHKPRVWKFYCRAPKDKNQLAMLTQRVLLINDLYYELFALKKESQERWVKMLEDLAGTRPLKQKWGELQGEIDKLDPKKDSKQIKKLKEEQKKVSADRKKLEDDTKASTIYLAKNKELKNQFKEYNRKNIRFAKTLGAKDEQTNIASDNVNSGKARSENPPNTLRWRLDQKKRTWGQLKEGKDKAIKIVGTGKYRTLKVRMVTKPAEFVDFSIYLDREPDDSSQITELRLQLREHGGGHKWFAYFRVYQEDKRKTGTETWACDLNWRLTKEGLKAVTFLSENGEYFEVSYPQDYVEMRKLVDQLKSRRDNEANGLVEILVNEKDKLTKPVQDLLKIRHLIRNSVVLLRKISAISVDARIHDWLNHDSHLWREQIGLSRHCNDWLVYSQRAIAAYLRQKCGTLLMDSVGVKKIKEKKGDVKAVKTKQNLSASLASPGKLRQILMTAINSVKVDCKNTTRKCEGCGHINPKSEKERIKCESCGLESDRDLRSTSNMLQDFLQKPVRPTKKLSGPTLKIRHGNGRKLLQEKKIEPEGCRPIVSGT